MSKVVKCSGFFFFFVMPTHKDHSYGISSQYLQVGLSLFSTFFHFSKDTHLFLFIFVGSMQLDASLFVGIEIVYSLGLSLFSTFTVTVFDANSQ